MLYLIFTEANRNCKDMYNIYTSRKKKAIKAVHKKNDCEFVKKSVNIFELPVKTIKASFAIISNITPNNCNKILFIKIKTKKHSALYIL